MAGHRSLAASRTGTAIFLDLAMVHIKGSTYLYSVVLHPALSFAGITALLRFAGHPV